MCSSQTALRNLTSCLCAKGRITKHPNKASPNETAEYWDRKEAYLEKINLNIGLELARNGSSCGGISSKRGKYHLHLKRLSILASVAS